MLHSTKRHCKVLAVVTSLVLLASPASATYWSLFNEEGSSSGDPNIVTYDTLTDMLGDINRTGVFTPNPFGFGRNIVGTGSDGMTYWNLFNEEGSSSGDPNIVTYGTLTDMLGDINRTGVFTPNPFGFGTNIVGVGADFQRVSTIPEPSTMGLFGLGFAILCILWRRRAT